ncbi:putative MFS family arabinose efflux permease [Streptosporangium becharense]|uniref:Putative MFS family arabinose efflux permease n=1 Tax=Streptosporangium becharense TaxID=1816182 RepID=A0A7W9MJB9_9ACTN|nr:MFS transporter [Streptosporangium becharense]MBB2911676.1 putative MFS family arabinose efflux permease [Streptosporangium becharense]MBB5822506.1 putative MFS family arabinose efflux permease [Streptosporangium becharense]
MTSRRTLDRSQPSGEAGHRSPWGAIAVVYLGGVVAAMSLGKFASVGPAVAAQLGLSLSQLGWVISAVVGVGAAAGLPAGYLVRRFGAERSLVTGLVLIAAASAASVATGDFTWLLAARFVEGVGYVLVTIACPALILRLARERDRGTALSIWATFVPVGLGASTLAGGAIGSALGWRGWIGLIAGLTLVTALAARMSLPRAAERQAVAGPVPRLRELTRPAALAASFCLAALVTIPVVVLLPTLLIEQHGRSAVAAGAMTSVISLLGVLGGLAVGVLLRRGTPVGVLALFGLLVVPAAWLVYGGDGSAAVVLAGAGVISMGNGFLGALVFAALPLVLERLDHADVGNGLVAQAGSLGSLLGPPLFGLVAGVGYRALVPVIALGILAAVGSLLLAGARTPRPPAM